MKNKMSMVLRKCKSLSRQLGRSSSYSSLRSKSSNKDQDLWDQMLQNGEHFETILVGSTRKRYMIRSKYLNHPLLSALMERSKQKEGKKENEEKDTDVVHVKCEVVLFDHLLWMLENVEPNAILDSLEELTELYLQF